MKLAAMVTAAALALGAAASGAQAAAEGEVRLLVHEGYADADWVQAFEAEAGIKALVTYVGGVDEQIAKMKASEGRDYDVVAVDTASLKAFADQKLVAPLDPAKLTSLANLAPEFRPLANATFDGKAYGVPLAWGSLGLVHDKEVFPEPPKSRSVLWDPAYKGQVISLDDANNCVNFAAIALGFADPFRLSDAQFAAVKRKLAELRPNLLTYYAGFDEGTTVWAENRVHLMFAMGELNRINLEKQGFDVGYTIPQEGAVGWLDNLTVSAGSPNPEAAYAWINFVLQPKIGADMTAKSGYGSTTAAAPGMDYAGRLKWAVTPEDYARRQQLWNEVKAGLN